MNDVLFLLAVTFLSYWGGRSLVIVSREVQDKMARLYEPQLTSVYPNFKYTL